MSYNRTIDRAKAKKIFKEVKKQSPQYKHLRFTDFMKLYKAGFLAQEKRREHSHTHEHEHEALHEVADLLIDDDIDEGI